MFVQINIVFLLNLCDEVEMRMMMGKDEYRIEQRNGKKLIKKNFSILTPFITSHRIHPPLRHWHAAHHIASRNAAAEVPATDESWWRMLSADCRANGERRMGKSFIFWLKNNSDLNSSLWRMLIIISSIFIFIIFIIFISSQSVVCFLITILIRKIYSILIW